MTRLFLGAAYCTRSLYCKGQESHLETCSSLCIFSVCTGGKSLYRSAQTHLTPAFTSPKRAFDTALGLLGTWLLSPHLDSLLRIPGKTRPHTGPTRRETKPLDDSESTLTSSDERNATLSCASLDNVFVPT